MRIYRVMDGKLHVLGAEGGGCQRWDGVNADKAIKAVMELQQQRDELAAALRELEEYTYTVLQVQADRLGIKWKKDPREQNKPLMRANAALKRVEEGK